jgi:hypothetical protein
LDAKNAWSNLYSPPLQTPNSCGIHHLFLSRIIPLLSRMFGPLGSLNVTSWSQCLHECTCPKCNARSDKDEKCKVLRWEFNWCCMTNYRIII